MFIKPARENLIVRDPQTFEILPNEGKEVGTANLFYWKRRIIDGDVIEVKAEVISETLTENLIVPKTKEGKK